MAKTKSRKGRIVAGNSSVLAERDWDSDEFDPYGLAVTTVLEALEGLWFESSDPKLETEVNEHVQRIKREIQEML